MSASGHKAFEQPAELSQQARESDADYSDAQDQGYLLSSGAVLEEALSGHTGTDTARA